MVTMMVLGIGLVSVMAAFSACSRSLGRFRGEAVAANFAANMLSEMRANPGLLMSGDEGEVGPEYPGFTWTKELRESAQPGVLAVRVTVFWSTQGVSYEYELASLVQAAGM
jgi:hypothetical protein